MTLRLGSHPLQLTLTNAFYVRSIAVQNQLSADAVRSASRIHPKSVHYFNILIELQRLFSYYANCNSTLCYFNLNVYYVNVIVMPYHVFERLLAAPLPD